MQGKTKLSNARVQDVRQWSFQRCSQELLFWGSETCYAFFTITNMKPQQLGRGNPLPPNFHTGFVKISQVTFAMAKGSRSLDPLANYILGLPSPTNIPSLETTSFAFKASRHRKYQLISANIFHSISGMYDKRNGHVQVIQSILTIRRVLVESLLSSEHMADR